MDYSSVELFVIEHRDRSALVLIEGEEVVLPYSQCGGLHRIDTDKEGVVEVPDWILRDRGLEDCIS